MTQQASSTANTCPVEISEAAIAEAIRLMGREKQDNLYLRLGVAAGGCSGMSYVMAFDTDKQENDKEFSAGDLSILVSEDAVSYLNGTLLDFKGGLVGGGFTFENPNASRSCGCGSSFSC